jgi:flagellin
MQKRQSGRRKTLTGAESKMRRKAQTGISEGALPMALGVLNNLSAIYAENNLNNTSNSLQSVLQQLSSGSKINSGADDSAGLSLVNGLAANSQALTQSKTNATEGVGLLDVADGALSQVTSLLNRAVTLATEASNGTLNTAQEAAANQEYTSIMSEVNNIGSTTTYNQEQVFAGKTVSIYTGDSSISGSSIDNLNISTLSQSSVGDTKGAMSYTSGSSGSSGNSVWIDLGSTSAATTDALNGGAAASIVVNSLTSTGTISSTTLSTSTNSTVSDMISEINNSGLGLTASLSTGAVAGWTGAGSTDEGIMITGSVGTGATPTPSIASFSGSFTTATATTDTLSGSLTIQSGTGAAHTVTMAEVAAAEGSSTLGSLENYIQDNGSLGVSEGASLGTTTMTLSSAGGSTDALTISSSLQDTFNGTAMNYTPTAAFADGIVNSTGLYDSGLGGQNSNDTAVTGTTSSSSGIATTSYTDGSGEDLGSTDLLSQGDSQIALNDLNIAITDVSSMDGYIGAQINTLNSVSSVLTTQSENVVSAQNAIQATDYASATSNMSKYEILSQTGIAALAQANTVQQEVTKLLQ